MAMLRCTPRPYLPTHPGIISYTPVGGRNERDKNERDKNGRDRNERDRNERGRNDRKRPR